MKYQFIIYSFIGRLLSIIPGKNNNIWVFGARDGFEYADNSKYLFEWILSKKKNINPYWITRDKNIVGSNFLYFYSLKTQWIISRASNAICSHGSNDITLFLSKKINYILLWHGIPIKKIGIDTNSSTGKNNILWSIIKKILNVKKTPDLFLATSESQKEIFKKAFSIPHSNIFIAQYPRITYMLESIKKTYNSKKYILYAPTFRDNVSPDYYSINNIIPNDNILLKINESLQKINYTLLIKPHPYIPIEAEKTKSLSNITLIHKTDDILKYLVSCDVLLTDYSGVFFDFLMLSKPIIFFSPDLNWYLSKNNRGLYYDYENFVPGPIVSTWDEMLTMLSNSDFYSPYKEKSHTLKENIFSHPQNKNDFIFHKIITL
ncbi:CDP-glycerol glycerophosphotransferase family protein [Providencia rettgeri]|uniref:CDP-glycerol glycerophosphotransferase family protein n=1 Tax=Providencia rettgeri TaxID=587 RepID=UPI001B3706E4|nr:CDP-glycerol glycerophosphotransferase family protein [Providencia rettgeri]